MTCKRAQMIPMKFGGSPGSRWSYRAFDAADKPVCSAAMGRTLDAVVIGAGQSGPSLAVRLAKAGKRVALVERRGLGGTCVNDGCIPTKTLVASARAAWVVRNAAAYGVDV